MVNNQKHLSLHEFIFIFKEWNVAEHFFYLTIGCFNHGNSGLRSTIFKVHKRWQPVQNDDMNEISLIRWPFARIHALTEWLYYLASMCLNFKRLQSLLVLWYRKMCTAEEMGWTTKNLKYQFWNTLSMDLMFQLNTYFPSYIRWNARQ